MILVPFKALAERFSELSIGSAVSAAAHEQLVGVVKVMLASVKVDDAWYRDQYPDVAAAIDHGDYESTQRHFMDHGYFEARLPCLLEVDEAWYLSAYDDIARGIEDGVIASAEEHYNTHGYKEGRLPMNLWS